MPPTIGNVTVLGKSGPTSTWYPDQVFTGQHNNNGNYVYFVGWWWYDDPNVMPTVTYGGQSMTNVYWARGMWGLSRAFGVWELANAPTGVNNVVVSCDHDGLSALAYVALSVQNVTARGNVAVADGLFTSDDPAINVASTTGDLVIDMLFANSHDNNTLLTGIPGTGQTSVFTNDYVFPNSPMFGGISTKEAGGSTTPMAWDLSGGDGVWTFRHIGFALSGGSQTFQVQLSGSTDSAGGLNQKPMLGFSGAMDSGGGLGLMPMVGFSGATDSAGVLATAPLFQVYLTGSMDSVGSLNQYVRMSLVGVTDSVGALDQLIRLALSGTTVSSGEFSYGGQSFQVGGVTDSFGVVNFLVRQFLSGVMPSIGNLDPRVNILYDVSLSGETSSFGNVRFCFVTPEFYSLGYMRQLLWKRIGRPQDVSPSLLNNCINQGLRHLLRRLHHKTNKRTMDLTTTNGVRDYELPENVYSIVLVWCDQYQLRKVGPGLRDRYYGSGAPTAYETVENKIRFYPTPDGNYVVHLDFLVTHELLNCDPDVPAIHAMWHDGILFAAEWYYWRTVQQVDRAKMAWNMLQMWLQDIGPDIWEERADEEHFGLIVFDA